MVREKDEEWKKRGRRRGMEGRREKVEEKQIGKNDSADRNINRDEKGDIVRKNLKKLKRRRKEGGIKEGNEKKGK